MDELGTFAKIAIIVIIICVLIGIVFGIISFAKGKTDEGTATMESTMSAMSEADWNQFDQQVKTGSQVMSTMQLNEGKDVAFVVETLRGSAINYGAILTSIPTFDTGIHVESDGLKDLAGTTEKPNKDYAAARNSSHVEYIRGTAKFDAKLIKDAGGQIIGVYFKQKEN